jgi:hypothetical protein
MMVMPANNSSGVVHWIAGKYPGKIGWLQSPLSWKLPRLWIPYALDNDAFTSWRLEREWNEKVWLDGLMLAKRCGQPPIWVLVPDVVGDRIGTLERWKRYSSKVIDMGFTPAFAAQDGMTPDDVPEGVAVVFVGGTTEWKWKSIPVWTKHFKRVHVGRVNELRRLWTCDDLGVESVDGTGWFRDVNGRQYQGLLQFVEGIRNETMKLGLG